MLKERAMCCARCYYVGAPVCQREAVRASAHVRQMMIARRSAAAEARMLRLFAVFSRRSRCRTRRYAASHASAAATWIFFRCLFSASCRHTRRCRHVFRRFLPAACHAYAFSLLSPLWFAAFSAT
jgi:hypothetical protein